MTAGKPIALTIGNLVSKVMSLGFLIHCLGFSKLVFPGERGFFFLFCFVFVFVFNFMAAVTIQCDFGTRKYKVSQCFHCFPFYLPWCVGTRRHGLVFWMLSFKPVSSLSSLIFIKRLFISSLLSFLKVVSSAYLRLFLFLLAILIPAWVSSSLAFHMICSPYKYAGERIG